LRNYKSCLKIAPIIPYAEEGVEVTQKVRRHKDDTKTFEELTYNEQALAMNMTALQFRKQLAAHLRRAEQEDRVVEDVLRVRLGLLKKILDDFPEPKISIQLSKATS